MEKHALTYEIKGSDTVVNGEKEVFYYLKPGFSANAMFKNAKDGMLYSYCNKHGLWEIEIK